MPVEIERKFLVKPGMEPVNVDGVKIRQGYLNTDKDKSIRIRTAGHQSFLTIKGPDHGGVRDEFEYEIPFEHAEYMLDAFCGDRILTKIRRMILWKKHLWEVDEFLGNNQGLWVAEIELESIDEPFSLPPWIGEEVTADIRYLNTYLVIHPFTTWKTTQD